MIVVRYISCILLALMFIVFAGLQYNDPDPEVWIPVYMLSALLSLVAIFRPLPKVLLLILIVVYIAGAIYLWPDRYEGVTMPMSHKPNIEYARESLGLLICALAKCWLLFLSSRKNVYLKPIPSA
ncbi:MAG: transmembrane 220 family protein [Cytophagaceae bacterium]|nr:transmembrane 220 family protein [Cytophagaceae bacterium]